MLIGTTIGKYRIIKELGHGGMGVVYLAEHVHLEKKYALKVLPSELSANPEFVARFHREAKVMAELEHPGIVRVVNFGIEDGTFYLVMDYVAGPSGETLTLEDHLREANGRLPEDEVRHLARGICEALRYAHGYRGTASDGTAYHGVVHRDLKPANILLDRAMKARIADFGLARVLGDDYVKSRVEKSVAMSISLGRSDSLASSPTRLEVPAGGDSLAGAGTDYGEKPDFRRTTTGALLGTYDFMSPEQKRGGAVDTRSDIYALGVVVYQMLTGKKPLGAFDYPTEVDASLSPNWDALVRGCLKEDPEKRLASVDEVMALVDGPQQKDTKKRKPLVAYLLALVLVLAVAAGGAWYAWQRMTGEVEIGDSAGRPPVVSDQDMSAVDGRDKPDEPGGTGETESGGQASATGTPGGETHAPGTTVPTGPVGTIRVTTDPLGAVVYFGSESLGGCPEDGLLISKEAPGEYVFRAEMDGFLPGKASCEVEEDREITLKITLDPKPGKVAVSSVPTEARVFIDGEEVGLTPYRSPGFTLVPGVEHLLLLKKKDWKDREVPFTVERGQEQDLGEITLIKAEGWLSVVTEPSGARVYLPDNTLLGTTPVKRARLPVGQCTLKLKHDGYQALEVPVTVREDTETEVSRTLQESRATKVTRLLGEASARLDAGKYTTPEDECAFALFQQVLSLDPGNSEAAAGIQTIYAYYYKNGESYLASSDYERARYHFNKCLEVNPGDAVASGKLSEVVRKEREETARKLAAQKAEAERKQREEAARRQAEEERKRREAAARAPSIGQEKTVNLGSGVKLELVWIPAGEFMMGSPSTEAQRDNDEGPRHRVKITKGFWMGKHEVTQAQWESVMGNNPSRFKGSDNPVEQVSWNDCQEFLKKLARQTGQRFRLPTEAEWEYACRAGTETVFHYGDSLSSRQANFNGNHPYGGASKGTYVKKTTSVGSYRPNAFGLYDMHGNVWEWCYDWKRDYSSGTHTDPQGPSSGSYRVLRGGSWGSYAGICRSAYRINGTPDDGDDRSGGFRIVFPSSED